MSPGAEADAGGLAPVLLCVMPLVPSGDWALLVGGGALDGLVDMPGMDCMLLPVCVSASCCSFRFFVASFSEDDSFIAAPCT